MRRIHYLCFFGLLIGLVATLSQEVVAQVIEPAATCAAFPTGNLSLLYRTGNALCWHFGSGNDKAVRLIGALGYDLTREGTYPFANFTNILQFKSDADPLKRHGVNLMRMSAFAASNVPDCLTAAGVDPDRPPTRMPFVTTGAICSSTNLFPIYNLCLHSSACTGTIVGLDSTYRDRLQNVLDEARKNGIIVELTLFDGFHLGDNTGGSNPQPLYAKNPWNPLNNNLDTTIFDVECRQALPESPNRNNTLIDAFPEFYDICTNKASASTCNSSLKCLGLLQKKYVEKMVLAVKNNTSGSDHVFFEIMNEAPVGQTTPAQLALWHDTVGLWIKSFSNGDYLVSASVSPFAFADLQHCNSKTDCPNQFLVFFQDNIDVVTLHGKTWENAGTNPPCSAASEAVTTFGKPVILDTDGASGARDIKCTVQNWAEKATLRADEPNGGCRGLGRVHFNHIDGMTFDGPTKACGFNGVDTLKNYHDKYLDCFVLDTIGDVGPTRLSNIITLTPATSCPHFNLNPPGWCEHNCDTDPGGATLTATPATLTADGSMVPIVITTGVEEAGVSLTLLSIEANEPMSEYDIQSADVGADDRLFWLKGAKNTDTERIYTITYLLTDSLGNTNLAIVTVSVP